MWTSELPVILDVQLDGVVRGRVLQCIIKQVMQHLADLHPADELCEALTLLQTGKIRGYPVLLIGTEYWKPFISLLREMVDEGAVAAADLDLLKVTDDLDEAMQHIESHTIGSFGLRRGRKPKWWLGE